MTWDLRLGKLTKSSRVGCCIGFCNCTDQGDVSQYTREQPTQVSSQWASCCGAVGTIPLSRYVPQHAKSTNLFGFGKQCDTFAVQDIANSSSFTMFI